LIIINIDIHSIYSMSSRNPSNNFSLSATASYSYLQDIWFWFSINCIFCILSYNINWKNPKITIVYTNAIIYLSTKERIEKVQKTQWPRENGQKDKQGSTKHYTINKRYHLKTKRELRFSGRVGTSYSFRRFTVEHHQIWKSYWTPLYVNKHK
jgi:hypothetical protein